MTTTIYRHTDGGAPRLSSLPGSLIQVLDFALLGSGWTKPYSKFVSGVEVGAVYQQGGGNGYYLKVDDEFRLLAPPNPPSDNSYGNAAIVTGYKSMSSYDVGTQPFPNVKGYVSGITLTDSPGDVANCLPIYFRKASGAVLGSFLDSGSFATTVMIGSDLLVSPTQIQGRLQNGAVVVNPCLPPGTIVLSFIDPVTVKVSNPATISASNTTTYTQNVGYTSWTVVATEKGFYFHHQWLTNRVMMYYFGDFVSHKAGDTNNCILIGTRETGANPSLINSEIQFLESSTSTPMKSSASPGFSFFDYNPTALTSAKDTGIDGQNSISVGGTLFYGLKYPDPSTGMLFIEPVSLMDAGQGDGSHIYAERGTLPGLWTALTAFGSAPYVFNSGDTFDGTGELAGKTFEVFSVLRISGTDDVLAVVETSNTW